MILDVDGTLIDSNDAHARAWVEAFADYGITVAFDRVRRAIGMGGDKLMPAVSRIEEDTPAGRWIAERRGMIFSREHLPGLKAFPGVRALVERLDRERFVVTVASSAKKEELRRLLEIAGVRDLVADEASSDDAERSKPDPDIVQAALKRAGCPASRAVMIGDTPYDIAAAGRAGVMTVAFECGGWSRAELRGARAVYEGPADLLKQYEASILPQLRQATALSSTS